jgi:hypothetical protein
MLYFQFFYFNFIMIIYNMTDFKDISFNEFISLLKFSNVIFQLVSTATATSTDYDSPISVMTIPHNHELWYKRTRLGELNATTTVYKPSNMTLQTGLVDANSYTLFYHPEQPARADKVVYIRENDGPFVETAIHQLANVNPPKVADFTFILNDDKTVYLSYSGNILDRYLYISPPRYPLPVLPVHEAIGTKNNSNYNIKFKFRLVFENQISDNVELILRMRHWFVN